MQVLNSVVIQPTVQQPLVQPSQQTAFAGHQNAFMGYLYPMQSYNVEPSQVIQALASVRNNYITMQQSNKGTNQRKQNAVYLSQPFSPQGPAPTFFSPLLSPKPSGIVRHVRRANEVQSRNQNQLQTEQGREQHLTDGHLKGIQRALQGTNGDINIEKPRKIELWQTLVDGMVLPSGYTVSLACGPLKKARYINPKIEKELVEFKEEISEKYEASDMNKTYSFPKKSGQINPRISRNFASSQESSLQPTVRAASQVVVPDDDEVQFGEVRKSSERKYPKLAREPMPQQEPVRELARESTRVASRDAARNFSREPQRTVFSTTNKHMATQSSRRPAPTMHQGQGEQKFMKVDKTRPDVENEFSEQQIDSIFDLERGNEHRMKRLEAAKREADRVLSAAGGRSKRLEERINQQVTTKQTLNRLPTKHSGDQRKKKTNRVVTDRPIYQSFAHNEPADSNVPRVRREPQNILYISSDHSRQPNASRPLSHLNNERPATQIGSILSPYARQFEPLFSPPNNRPTAKPVLFKAAQMNAASKPPSHNVPSFFLSEAQNFISPLINPNGHSKVHPAVKQSNHQRNLTQMVSPSALTASEIHFLSQKMHQQIQRQNQIQTLQTPISQVNVPIRGDYKATKEEERYKDKKYNQIVDQLTKGRGIQHSNRQRDEIVRNNKTTVVSSLDSGQIIRKPTVKQTLMNRNHDIYF